MDDDLDDWHPVRIPAPDQLGPRRGLPADKIDEAGMRVWCESDCRGRWVIRPTANGGTLCLFADPGDAMAFALRWFPYKCS